MSDAHPSPATAAWRPGPVACWVLPLVLVVVPAALHVAGLVVPHAIGGPDDPDSAWPLADGTWWAPLFGPAVVSALLLPLAVPFVALVLGSAVAEDRRAHRPVPRGAVAGLVTCAVVALLVLSPWGAPLLPLAMD